MKLRTLLTPVAALTALSAFAQEAAAPAAQAVTATAAPDFLEHLLDLILAAFDVQSTGNDLTRFLIAVAITLIAYVLRRVVTTVIFSVLKKFAARTETTLDDKLFPALQTPVAALIVVVGTVASIKVLKLAPNVDQTISYIYTAAFSLVVFWGFIRAFNTVLDHLQEIAAEKQLGITPFMPWIKKSLLAIVFIFGVLMIAQSLGADVKAFLAGLGIGGLAFALAAQDTIANVFGSVVVAIDQPFCVGETVRIAGHVGTVEDIGLRSTKLRLLDKSLVGIPNRTVANEAIINLSRFTQRRVEQVIGLTYSTSPAQMEAIVEDFRRAILAEANVDPKSVMVFFRDLSASSLDLWIVYVINDANFENHMLVRHRLNLAFMRAVEARGLAFAFPTQTLHIASLPSAAASAEKTSA